jgi:hypothetical protein
LKLKIILFFGIPLLILAIIAYITLPWLLIFIGINIGPNPSLPEKTHGEFPFRLEYEVNGQRKVIKDTLICDYDGIGLDEGRGKFRKWKERLASGNKRTTLLKIDDTKEIYYDPGYAKYYMGDMESGVEFGHFFPNASIIVKEGKFSDDGIIYADELLEKYKIKLISWDYTPPIKNKFSEP